MLFEIAERKVILFLKVDQDLSLGNTGRHGHSTKNNLIPAR